MIDQPTIDRILDAANIVDIVSEFVTLRRRGVNYVGLCPFHSDKTPSFYVSPAKNICKCFACGEGGTSVHFIMKHEQLGYYDALRFLAKKYGIEVQERELTDKEKQIRSDRESMLIVNTWAQQYFSEQLYESEEGKTIGLRYFRERGFREDIIKKFQLGYSLNKRDNLYQEAIQKGYQAEFLEKTGLVIAYENKSVSDRFRGRVIFPVHSLSGKVVAFGGRILKKDDKAAKYVNSPESDIYHKSHELYGIFFAKQPIVKEDRCYLVEGYTDVISMHQAGIENVVASSGTALTQGQIRLIRRFTNNITVLYDGDAAGIKAAIRGIDMLLEEGMNIKVLLLPANEDPDSFARKHNATEFIEYIRKNETDFIQFKTQLLLNDAGEDPIKRSTLINDIIRSVAVIPDNIARTVYIRECSSMLDVDERILLNEVNKIRLANNEKRANIQSNIPLPTPPPPDPYSNEDVEHVENSEAVPAAPATTAVQSKKQSPYERNELMLLRYIVRYGEKILYSYEEEGVEEKTEILVAEYIFHELAQDDLTFNNPLYKKMLEEAVSHQKEEGFIASRFFMYHPDPEVSQLATNLMSDKYQLSKYHFKFRTEEKEEDRLQQLILKDIFSLKGAYINSRIQEIQTEIKEAQKTKDSEKMVELMQQLTQLNKIKNHLSKELGERIILKM